MLRLTDICSLSDFQRNAKAVLEQLRRSGLPHVLTVNGKAQVVVQDAAAYQKLLDLLDRAAAIEGIRIGLSQVAAGRTKAAARAFEEMRARRRIKRGS